MKYIIPPSRDIGCVAVNDDADESGLVARLRRADIILADLDGTDASAGLNFVLYSTGEPEFFLALKCWKWLFKSGYLYAKYRGKAESEIGKAFMDVFMRSEKHVQRIKDIFTQEFTKSLLYEGVPEFYDLLRGDLLRVYVSRNHEEVVKAFFRALAFNDYFAEEFDKKETVKKALDRFPYRKRFIVKGDTMHDEEMYDELKYWKDKKKRIEEVTYINIMSSPKYYNPRADINASRNHTALNMWIKSETKI